MMLMAQIPSDAVGQDLLGFGIYIATFGSIGGWVIYLLFKGK